MIRIGETHYVDVTIPHRDDDDLPDDVEATEAVKRLVEAAKAMIEPPVWEEAQAELRAALAPFTDTDASLVDSGLRSCATPENEERREMSKAIEDIAAERRRQIEAEGWAPEHDDQHEDGSLAQAALAYTAVALADNCERAVMDEFGDFGSIPFKYLDMWPKSWAAMWFKPKSRRHDLVRAAALIAAEIERLDRALLRQIKGDQHG